MNYCDFGQNSDKFSDILNIWELYSLALGVLLKVSPSVKVHHNTHNSVKYEVFVKQYLRAILDTSEHKMMMQFNGFI